MKVYRSSISPIGLEVLSVVLAAILIAVGWEVWAGVLVLFAALVLFGIASQFLSKEGKLLKHLTSAPDAAPEDFRPGARVRVTGDVVETGPLTDPVLGEPCAYYRVKVSRRVLLPDDYDPDPDWYNAATLEDADSFVLESTVGRVRVVTGSRLLTAIEAGEPGGEVKEGGFEHPSLGKPIPGPVRIERIVAGVGDTVTLVGRVRDGSAPDCDVILEPIEDQTILAYQHSDDER